MTATTINGKKPKFLNSRIAEQGTKNDIQATGSESQVSQAFGFGKDFSSPRGSGGKSVGRADMNGLFHDVSTLNYYFQFMGRNPWVNPGNSDDNAYPKGAKVWHNEAEYVSTDDTNKTEPGTTGAKWIKLNDLSGTSGGGTQVSCAWSGYSGEIRGLLDNVSAVNNRVNTISGQVSTLTSDVSTLKSDVSTLKSSVSTMSTKLDTISTKIENVSDIPVLKLDDSICIYRLPSAEAASSAASYELKFPGFLISDQTLYSNSDVTVQVDYNGQTFTLPFPTCRLDAGTLVGNVKYVPPSGGNSTNLGKKYAIAYDLSKANMSGGTTYTATTNSYTFDYGHVLTDADVSSMLNLSTTSMSVIRTTMQVSIETGFSGAYIVLYGGNVGSKAEVIFSKRMYTSGSLNVKSLIDDRYPYVFINCGFQGSSASKKFNVPYSILKQSIA